MSYFDLNEPPSPPSSSLIKTLWSIAFLISALILLFTDQGQDMISQLSRLGR